MACQHFLKDSPGVWCGIISFLQLVDPSFDTIRSSIRHVIGNGSSIRFWTDVWVRLVTLQNAFPRLFHVSPVLGMQQWQIQGNEFKEIGSGP